jgi:hypothetical protein
VPDDITGYTALEHGYDPRPGSRDAPPKELLGHYLERPVLHHTIGDRIVPSMLPLFEKYGVQSVTAHPEPPPLHASCVHQSVNRRGKRGTSGVIEVNPVRVHSAGERRERCPVHE